MLEQLMTLKGQTVTVTNETGMLFVTGTLEAEVRELWLVRVPFAMATFRIADIAKIRMDLRIIELA